ncbi:M1 family metallopeptidase [Hamadaea sp.]|uniref:M1 family metallopeptidase n=1 Tax=Hamadaea sp. TaxID=2024425 RepID=UPI0025B8A065|nr:M1 family metallopeptidase [Hamadaea sp.]
MTTRGKTVAAALAAAALAVTATGCTSHDKDSPTAVGSSAPAATPTPSLNFQPGAAGIGDPYYPTYGNGGYDVASYAIKVKYDPKTDRLTGDVTITATATSDLSAFDLDLRGMTVQSVEVNEKPATQARTGDELVITPDSGLATGAKFTVRVVYDGVPGSVTDPEVGKMGFFHTADGAFVVGEPESASLWFPVNDHPQDKAVYDVEVTVPAGLTAISNGVPGPQKTEAGWTTWKWSESTPMASYLTTLAIGDYRVVNSTHKGKPVVLGVTKQVAAGAADTSMSHTVAIADYLESVFGAYPFDSYGGVVVKDDDLHFALECQSRPVYSAGFFRRGVNDSVVVHELAHQWFGDSVSVKTWPDIWLNEGFASYAEWLWAEYKHTSTAQKMFDNVYATSDASIWRTPPAKPGKKELFGDSPYDRGAMTLHALRKAVGDKAFFEILKKWAEQKAGGVATTEEFIALAEQVSGKQLDALFQAWLYGTKKPAKP